MHSASPSYEIRTAKGIILWYMDRCGFDGLATPWRTIYIRDGHHSISLMNHEIKHIEQMDRYGTIWFCLLYGYQIIRYGYDKAPLEEEARAAETHS